MKKILYVDMDNVLVDFPSAFPLISAELLAEYCGREDEIPGIFGKMAPFPYAIESYEKLATLFDTYILSTSPWENRTAWSDKLDWVKQHLGQTAHKRLILTHNKHLNHGHFLIDDRLKNGADRFTGELVHFRGDNRFPDWPSVVAYLEPLAIEK